MSQLQDLLLRQPLPQQHSQPQQQQQAEPSSLLQPFEACWGADGGGLAARQLLRKLRWATVGPRYDWTARKYDLSGPHRPLPDFAAATAQRLAGLVQSRAAACRAADCGVDGAPAQQAEGTLREADCGLGHQRQRTSPLAAQPARHERSDWGSAAGGALPPDPQLSAEPPERPQQPSPCASAPCRITPGARPQPPTSNKVEPIDGAAGRASSGASAGAAGGVSSGGTPEAPVFRPDAALACFYRAGDTLCGHRDDAEADLTQVRPL